jgi:hypothetical protein
MDMYWYGYVFDTLLIDFEKNNWNFKMKLTMANYQTTTKNFKYQKKKKCVAYPQEDFLFIKLITSLE